MYAVWWWVSSTGITAIGASILWVTAPGMIWRACVRNMAYIFNVVASALQKRKYKITKGTNYGVF